MKTNEKEIARYLGYRGTEPEPSVRARIRALAAEFEDTCTPRSTYRIDPLTLHEDALMNLGPIRVQSLDLARNLRGCERVVLFAATLGSAPDYLIRRLERLNMADAAIAQAVSSAMIESYIDEQEAVLQQKLMREGLYLRPRFSPGYGDLPLSLQPSFLSVLDLRRRLGITLTDGFLMLPTKSVTAVIGLCRQPARTEASACDTCAKTDCEFKNKGDLYETCS